MVTANSRRGVGWKSSQPVLLSPVGAVATVSVVASPTIGEEEGGVGVGARNWLTSEEKQEMLEEA